MEGNALDRHVALGRLRQRHGIRRRADGRLGGEELGEALGGAGRPLQLSPGLCQDEGRIGDDHGVEDERREAARGEAPLEHVVRAHPHQHADRAEGEHDDRRDEKGEPRRTLHAGGENRVGERAERAVLARLVHAGLDGADLVQGLVDVRGDLGHAVLDRARQSPHATAEEADGKDHRRQAGEREDRELDAGEGEHHRASGEREGHAQRVEQRAPHHRLDERHVVGQARADLAGARRLEKGRREPQDVAVDLRAQVRGEARADPVDVVDAKPRHGAQRRHQRGEGGEPGVEEIGAAAGEALVDRALQSLADHEHHAGREEERHEGDRDARLVRREKAEERQQPPEAGGTANGARLPFRRPGGQFGFSRPGAGSVSPPCP